MHRSPTHPSPASPVLPFLFFLLPQLALLLACAASTPPPPPRPAAAPPPPPKGAHWVFDGPPHRWIGKVDLGADAVLLVDPNGRRQLRKGTERTDAETLPPRGVIQCAARDARGRIGLLGIDGRVYVASSPLGPFEEEHPTPLSGKVGRTNGLIAAACGGHALMVATTHAQVLRSVDLGATWTEVDYASGDRWPGHAGAIALDGRGGGLLVHFPQRLYVTKNDGESWSPLASPGIGASSVSVDDTGALFLEGTYQAQAVLEDGALRETKRQGAPLGAATNPREPGDVKEYEVRRVLVADHAVTFTRRENRNAASSENWVTEGALGAAGTPHRATPLDKADERSIAVHGRLMAALRRSVDGTASTLIRSEDFGTTWTDDLVVDGSVPEPQNGISEAAVFVGPRGWTYVGPLCKAGEWQEERYPLPPQEDCAPATLRVADAGLPEEPHGLKDVPKRVLFDAVLERAYALLQDEDRKWSIFEAPLTENRWSRIELDTTDLEPANLTVDLEGTLRLFVWNKEGWVLRQRRRDGTVVPDVRLDGLPGGELAFAGARGVLYVDEQGWEEKREVWETADAGDTWSSAPGGAGSPVECTEHACRFAYGIRAGWSLPAGARGARDARAASPPPAAQPPSVPAAPPSPPSPLPRVELQCDVHGPRATLPGEPQFLDGQTHDAHWVAFKEAPDHALSLVVGGASAVRELPMLPRVRARTPKPSMQARRDGGGVVAYRTRPSPAPLRELSLEYECGLHTDHDGNPIPREAPATEVELAWWAPHLARPAHAVLPAVLDPGEPKLVADGSGVLLPTCAPETFLFVRDGGDTTAVHATDGADVRDLDRVAGRWLLVQTRRANAVIATTVDGRTWEQKAWGLYGENSARLLDIEGKPFVDVEMHTRKLLIPVAFPLTNDPPRPLVRRFVDGDCGAGRPGASTEAVQIPSNHRVLHAIFGKEASSPLIETTRFVREGADARQCTAGYVLRGKAGTSLYLDRNQEAFVGWRFFPAGSAGGKGRAEVIGESVRCVTRPTSGAANRPELSTK
jgi:hypothetical protein